MKKFELRQIIREEVRKVIKERKSGLINEVLISSGDTFQDLLETPYLFLSHVYGPTANSKAAGDEYTDPDWIKFEKEWLAKAMPIIKKFKANATVPVPKAMISKLNSVADDDDSLIGYPEYEIDSYPKTWTKQLKVLTALASTLN